MVYYPKHRVKLETELLFFPNHGNGFFRAFICTDSAPFTEPEVNFKVFVDCLVWAVHRTETALVTFFFVHDRSEHTP